MEFEGKYLTYEEYKSLGGNLDSPSFDLLEFHARNQIDLRTQNRLVGEIEIPEKVKICDFDLIEKIYSYAESTKKIDENNGIASFNSDGYSETYITQSEIKEIIKSKNAELQDIMMVDLYGVIVNGEHILFNGVKR